MIIRLCLFFGYFTHKCKHSSRLNSQKRNCLVIKKKVLSAVIVDLPNYPPQKMF